MKRMLVLLACVVSAGCAGHGRRARMPKDLRDAPAALRRPVHSSLMEPRLGRPGIERDMPIGGPFETTLALWSRSMRQAIDGAGGLSKLPENLRLRIGIRMSAVDALYERDPEGRLRARMAKFATQPPRELLEWIEPVQRFYRNALEKNASIPVTLRREPAYHYEALKRLAHRSSR